MRHFSISAFIFSLLAITVAAGPTLAQTSSHPASRTESLDPSDIEHDLLLALKRERDAEKAEGIAKEVISLWEDYESVTINTLLQRGIAATDEKNYAAALDYFDQVITLEPDYFQAYYRRAYVNFAEGQTAKAISDLYKTLEQKPAHFAALFELARLLSHSGHDKAAVSALERFLEIYPSFKEARELHTELSEKLAGTRS